MSAGYVDVRHLAPGAAGAAGALEVFGMAAWAEAARSGRLGLMESVAVACADQHGLRPMTPPASVLPSGLGVSGPAGSPSGPDGPDGDRAVLAFARQFSVDVASLTAAQRSAFVDHLGGQAATVTAQIFVMDFVPRVGAAIAALSALTTLGAPGAPEGPAGPVAPDAGSGEVPLWDALTAFARVVPGLGSLDPVTTELIRLRGARQHRCRLCTSLRSRPALVAGAGEEVFDAIDDYENSDFTPARKAALAFTDAMVWTPARIDGPAARLAGLLPPAACVEVVFDITRNALNKIAVALEADAAHVADGVEIYDLDARGDPVYGLALD